MTNGNIIPLCLSSVPLRHSGEIFPALFHYFVLYFKIYARFQLWIVHWQPVWPPGTKVSSAGVFCWPSHKSFFCATFVKITINQIAQKPFITLISVSCTTSWKMTWDIEPPLKTHSFFLPASRCWGGLSTTYFIDWLLNPQPWCMAYPSQRETEFCNVTPFLSRHVLMTALSPLR